jgi:hypothetical protein
MSTDPLTVVGLVEVELRVEIAAARARVWAGLTAEAGRWRPKEFFVGEARDFVCEARVGGRVYEDWGGGQGLLWETVVTCQQEALLQTAGDLFPEFGGPGRVFNTFRLEAKGPGTVLTFSSTVLGRVTPKLRGELEAGWKRLYAEGLKAYAEAAEAEARAFGAECG